MKKTKKALFPFLAGALLLTMGLTACNNAKSDKPASSGDTSEVEETKINVTAAGNKTTLKVGETVQLSADVEGVEWSTRAGTVVSVDKDGLVTALGVGSGKVTAKSIDSTVACRIISISIDVSTRGERRHHNMAAKDDVVNMLFIVSSFITFCPSSVLVIDAAVENDRTFIASLSFKLELSETYESGFCDLEMTTGAETTEGEEILRIV